MELYKESLSSWVIFRHRQYSSNDRMTNELERISKKSVVTNFKALSGRFLGGPRKTTE
jgi:hypothetical protein